MEVNNELTSEAIRIDKDINEDVYAGTINEGSTILVILNGLRLLGSDKPDEGKTQPSFQMN